MAKKDRTKYDAPANAEGTPVVPQPEPETTSEPQGENTPAAADASPSPSPIKRGFYLAANLPDAHARVNYRFGKEDNYPKRAGGMNVKVDGLVTRMAVTSSGGWADEATKGYNGWFKFDHPTRGLVAGWILFGHGVNPNDWAPAVGEEPKLEFTIVDGTCDANPKRLPANAEGEAKRQEAAAAARAKKAAEAGTEGTPEAGTTEGTTETQPATEDQSA